MLESSGSQRVPLLQGNHEEGLEEMLTEDGCFFGAVASVGLQGSVWCWIWGQRWSPGPTVRMRRWPWSGNDEGETRPSPLHLSPVVPDLRLRASQLLLPALPKFCTMLDSSNPGLYRDGILETQVPESRQADNTRVQIRERGQQDGRYRGGEAGGTSSWGASGPGQEARVSLKHNRRLSEGF